MPLLPIDLQTMFSQLSQIGREQAVQKEVPPQYQAMQAAEIVRKTEHDDKAVNLAREPGEGPEKVRERTRRQREGRRARSLKPKQGEPGEKLDVLEDPDLGHHVNLVG